MSPAKQRSKWRRVKVIVEVPVNGDYSEKDLRFAVQDAVEKQGLWPYVYGDARPRFGRPLVKNFTSVMANQKR